MIDLSIHVKFLGVRRSKLKVGRMNTATCRSSYSERPNSQRNSWNREAAEVGASATRSLPKKTWIHWKSWHNDVPFIRITKLIMDSNNKTSRQHRNAHGRDERGFFIHRPTKKFTNPPVVLVKPRVPKCDDLSRRSLRKEQMGLRPQNLKKNMEKGLVQQPYFPG